MVKPHPTLRTDPRILDRMRNLREQAGLSHREVGEQLGMTGEGYRKKEIGALSVSGPLLARIARLYDMPLTEAFPEYEPDEGERLLARDLGGAS